MVRHVPLCFKEPIIKVQLMKKLGNRYSQAVIIVKEKVKGRVTDTIVLQHPREKEILNQILVLGSTFFDKS